MPPAPDLANVKFGEPMQLFNGKDLDGWRFTDPNAVNGWSVKDGLLVNVVAQEEGKPHKNYGNLRTDREFEDFNITLETRVPKAETAACICAAFTRSRWRTVTAARWTRTTWAPSTAASSRRRPPETPRRVADDGYYFRGPARDRHPERHAHH